MAWDAEFADDEDIQRGAQGERDLVGHRHTATR